MSLHEIETPFLYPWTDDDDHALEVYDSALSREQEAARHRLASVPVAERLENVFLTYAAQLIKQSLQNRNRQLE